MSIYPSEKELNEISQFTFKNTWDIRKFLEKIYDLWHHTYGTYIIEKNKKPKKLILITGGWSGNEDIIDAMAENHVFWESCWVKSIRGGRFEFELIRKILRG